MINNNNIEELVEQKLKHFEPEVSSNVWDKIEQDLAQLNPPVDSGGLSETVLQGSGANIGAWVAGIGAGVIGVVTVAFLVFNQPTPQAVVEETTNSETSISDVNNIIEPALENDNSIFETSPIKLKTEKKLQSVNATGTDKQNIVTQELNSETVGLVSKNEPIEPQINSTRKVESKIVEATGSQVVAGEQNSEALNTNTVIAGTDNGTPSIIETEQSIVEPELSKELIQEQIIEQEKANAKPSSIGPVPNVFTPNGDGINDHFIFPTDNITELTLNVYGKDGSLVYSKTSDAKWHWDGKLRNGQPAPIGSYYFAVFARGKDNQKHQHKGSLFLNR